MIKKTKRAILNWAFDFYSRRIMHYLAKGEMAKVERLLCRKKKLAAMLKNQITVDRRSLENS